MNLKLKTEPAKKVFQDARVKKAVRESIKDQQKMSQKADKLRAQYSKP